MAAAAGVAATGSPEVGGASSSEVIAAGSSEAVGSLTTPMIAGGAGDMAVGSALTAIKCRL
jgi:hypothetical protein